MSGEPSWDEVRDVLGDRAVRAALNRAVRDRRIRVQYRNSLGPSGERIELLRGPWLDVDGRPYYLSFDRVRSIAYGKPEN